MSRLIDSHCHLADPVFTADLEAVVERARTAGLERALVILAAGNASEAIQADRVASLWPEVRVAIGVHPHAAGAHAENPAEAAAIVEAQLARTPCARAIGEIGLDYHYQFAPHEVQQQVFRAQLRLARARDLPVVIHTRDAEDDTLRLLEEEGAGAIRGVVHCFTGTPGLARRAIELGLYISLSGIVTFPRANELRETVRAVPFDRLLIETDSPYLAPVPHRGRRNEPANVGLVAAALAALFGEPASRVEAQSKAAFHALFRP
jgi:TatD DNase family protein